MKTESFKRATEKWMQHKKQTELNSAVRVKA
jgi:hypothetical protein